MFVGFGCFYKFFFYVLVLFCVFALLFFGLCCTCSHVFVFCWISQCVVLSLHAKSVIVLLTCSRCSRLVVLAVGGNRRDENALRPWLDHLFQKRWGICMYGFCLLFGVGWGATPIQRRKTHRNQTLNRKLETQTPPNTNPNKSKNQPRT